MLYDEFDVFKHYNVDKYIGSYGLFVLEKYWGRGIGLKLVQTECVTSEWRLPIVSVYFTANIKQNFDTILEN